MYINIKLLVLTISAMGSSTGLDQEALYREIYIAVAANDPRQRELFARLEELEDHITAVVDEDESSENEG